MDYLFEFGERDDVRELVAAYLERSAMVQGLAVDLDDYWLASFRLYNLLPERRFKRSIRYLSDLVFHPRDRHPRLPRWLHRLDDEYVAYPAGIDPCWSFAGWEELTALRGTGPEPFVLVVVLRPEVNRESLEGLRSIPTAGVQVRFEPRPPARLYANPRDRVRPLVGGVSLSAPAGPAGTLGGILGNDTGGRFALTCSHVLREGEAQQPSPADNRSQAERIGECVESTQLVAHEPPLNPYNRSLNSVDAALVELDPEIRSAYEAFDLGPLSAVSPTGRINPSISVEVVGKVRGHSSVQVGAAVLAHEFDFDGQTFGFEKLFELRRAGRFSGITGSLSPPVRPGDSGGWVLGRGAGGSEWLGVVVGGDGPYGYAVPAEFVDQWLQTTGHGPLSVS